MLRTPRLVPTLTRTTTSRRAVFSDRADGAVPFAFAEELRNVDVGGAVRFVPAVSAVVVSVAEEPPGYASSFVSAENLMPVALWRTVPFVRSVGAVIVIIADVG